MTRIVGFCSPFMAASNHRVVTRYLSCLPMAIDTYICRACTKIIFFFLIFARKHMQDVLMDGAPSGSKGICTDNSWINGDFHLKPLDWRACQKFRCLQFSLPGATTNNIQVRYRPDVHWAVRTARPLTVPHQVHVLMCGSFHLPHTPTSVIFSLP